MRWTLGIVLGLSTVVAVNMFFLYIALQNPDETVESYDAVPKR